MVRGCCSPFQVKNLVQFWCNLYLHQVDFVDKWDILEVENSNFVLSLGRVRPDRRYRCLAQRLLINGFRVQVPGRSPKYGGWGTPLPSHVVVRGSADGQTLLFYCNLTATLLVVSGISSTNRRNPPYLALNQKLMPIYGG